MYAIAIVPSPGSRAMTGSPVTAPAANTGTNRMDHSRFDVVARGLGHFLAHRSDDDVAT
jgi:hypothetical protein